MGLVGIVLGASLGLLLAYHLNPVSNFLEQNFGISVFPSDIYLFDQIPAEINVSDVIWIVTSALFMSIVAGLYPAHRAARLLPVEALRYE